LSQDFRGRGRHWGIFFLFCKTRHILLFDSANCIVIRAVVWQRDGQTDRQTDEIAVASTALAMLLALRIAARCNKIEAVGNVGSRNDSLIDI